MALRDPLMGHEHGLSKAWMKLYQDPIIDRFLMRSEVCQCEQRLERNGVHGVLHQGLIWTLTAARHFPGVARQGCLSFVAATKKGHGLKFFCTLLS